MVLAVFPTVSRTQFCLGIHPFRADRITYLCADFLMVTDFTGRFTPQPPGLITVVSSCASSLICKYGRTLAPLFNQSHVHTHFCTHLPKFTRVYAHRQAYSRIQTCFHELTRPNKHLNAFMRICAHLYAVTHIRSKLRTSVTEPYVCPH